GEVLDQVLRLRRSHSPSGPVHLPCQARHLGTQALEIALGYRLDSSPDQVADIGQLGTRVALVAAGRGARPKGGCLRAARTLNEVSTVGDEELSRACRIEKRRGIRAHRQQTLKVNLRVLVLAQVKDGERVHSRQRYKEFSSRGIEAQGVRLRAAQRRVRNPDIYPADF